MSPTLMRQSLWVHGDTVTDPTSDTAQALLGAAWAQDGRALCQCRTPGVPMYIADVGSRYLVKRMPGSGPLHHHNCPSFAPYAPPVAGIGTPEPQRVAVCLDLPTAPTVARRRRRPRATGSRRTADGGEHLGLDELLAYLWREAGLDAWSPRMAGKRHWGVVSWHLREAADGKCVEGAPLRNRLYVPAPYRPTRREELTQRRREAWENARIADEPLLVIGEAKALSPAPFGHQLQIKHLPDGPIYLDDDVHQRLRSDHPAAVEMVENASTGHPMAIAAVTITRNGHARALGVALMKTTPEWLPYHYGVGRRIIGEAVRKQRRFTIGPDPSTTLVLTDTVEPISVHPVPFDQPGRTRDQPSWVWEPDQPWPPARTAPAPRPTGTASPRTVATAGAVRTTRPIGTTTSAKAHSLGGVGPQAGPTDEADTTDDPAPRGQLNPTRTFDKGHESGAGDITDEPTRRPA